MNVNKGIRTRFPISTGAAGSRSILFLKFVIRSKRKEEFKGPNVKFLCIRRVIGYITANPKFVAFKPDLRRSELAVSRKTASVCSIYRI